MFFRSIVDNYLAQTSYLIGCQRTGEAIIIDPERDIDRYIKLAAANNLTIIAVTETHIHADFLSGTRELAEKHNVKVYLSAEGGSDWSYQWLDRKESGGSYNFQLLHDGDSFSIGNIDFSVLHTPGHTPEHISFLVSDRGCGANAPMGILSGDFLFVGDVGRPDLLETAAGVKGTADTGARSLFQSLQRLENLAEFLQVWPAHGAGSACGKALGAVPQSTLGYELRFNPAIGAAKSESEFVNYILSGQPNPPLYFSRMKQENKLGPKLLKELPTPKEVSPRELSKLTRDAVCIDTRPWQNYKASHLPGALYLPLGSNFCAAVGSFIEPEMQIFLIADPSQVEDVTRLLVRIGLDNIISFVSGDSFNTFAKSSFQGMQTLHEIQPSEVERVIEEQKAFILDVRNVDEYAAGHLANAVNIPYTQLAKNVSKIPRDTTLVVYCQLGGRSALACGYLQREGFEVFNLAKGYAGLKSALS